MVTDCGIPASVWKPGCRQVAELWGSEPAQGQKTLLEDTQLRHCLSSWQRNPAETFFFFLAGILKSVNSFCRTEAVGGLFFSWLELEHTERAWNLTLPTIPWGGESLLSWWRYWKETKWPVGWPTVCLPRMEEFPQVGTPSANSRTIPGWFFTQKWVKVTQIVVRRSLGLKIMRVSRQQNFKGPSSSMRKPPQKTIHPFV